MNYSDEDILPNRVSDLERSMITEAYHKLGRNISNTARVLGISRATLYRKLKEFGLYGKKMGVQKPEVKHDIRSE
jgi:transcriptional regulator of acetoin/glycerol metabolism